MKTGAVTGTQADEIRELASRPGPWISIYLAIHRSGEPAQDRIRLKNMVDRLNQKLDERRMDVAQRRQLLAPLRARADSPDDHDPDARTLALFRSATDLRVLPMACEVKEEACLAPRIHIRPLARFLDQEGTFYLLSLSQKHIRLARCSRTRWEDVALPPDVPTNLTAWARTEAPDHVQDNRATAGPSRGAGSGVLFTTSTSQEGRDETLRHFYKAVSEALSSYLARHGTPPLVLAGVEYETPLFRDATAYPRLVAEPVRGAPDGMKNAELHQRAIDVMRKHWDQELDAILQQFEKQYGSGRATDRPEQVVQSSFEGRVLHLLMSEGGVFNGRFREDLNRLDGHPAAAAESEDLVNYAAVQTILHSGSLWTVPQGRLPGGGPVAAILRY